MGALIKKGALSRMGALIGIGALINKNTFGGGAYSEGGAYWKEGAKSNHYGMLISDEPLLSGQPPLYGALSVSKICLSQYFDIYTDIKLSVVTFMRWQWNFTVTLRNTS